MLFIMRNACMAVNGSEKEDILHRMNRIEG